MECSRISLRASLVKYSVLNHKGVPRQRKFCVMRPMKMDKQGLASRISNTVNPPYICKIHLQKKKCTPKTDSCCYSSPLFTVGHISLKSKISSNPVVFSFKENYFFSTVSKTLFLPQYLWHLCPLKDLLQTKNMDLLYLLYLIVILVYIS
jgi:hypothetical protein